MIIREEIRRLAKKTYEDRLVVSIPAIESAILEGVKLVLERPLKADTYWMIERGSPCEWWVGNHRIRNEDGGEWTTDASKALHFSELGARNHAKELESWGIKGPLRATEHMDCYGPVDDYRAMTQELLKELTEEDHNAETKRSTA